MRTNFVDNAFHHNSGANLMSHIQMLTSRKHVNEVDYHLFFEYRADRGAGYMLACDAHGNILGDSYMTKEGREAQAAKYRNDTATFLEPRVQKSYRSWIEPASGRCHCGTIVYLEDALENYCDGCNACYNMSGQHVHPELAEDI